MTRLFRVILWVCALLPGRGAVLVSRATGALMRLLQVDAWRVAQINLSMCLSDQPVAQRRQIARERMTHMGLTLFEFGHLLYNKEAKIFSRITSIEGAELLEQPEGVLLLVPHFGNWELLSAYLGKYHSVAGLYDPPRIQALEPILVQARERFAGEMFPIDAGGLRQIYRTLRAGKLSAMLPDQAPQQGAGAVAPFFGQPALTMTLVHRLTQKTNARIVLGSVQRDINKGLAYALRFTPVDQAIYSDDQTTALAALNEAVASVALQAPAQYQWEYKRFKRIDGMDNPYRRQ